jgi:hypothetical protein
MQWDVEKDTDIIEWWQVTLHIYISLSAHSKFRRTTLNLIRYLREWRLTFSYQDHKLHLSLFSGTKQVVTDRRACLGPVTFEEPTIMKSTWGTKIYNAGAWNISQIEEVSLLYFEHMLVDEIDTVKRGRDLEGWSDIELVV